ncbi:hypothetical protein [Sporomusa silvacetica]
MYGRLLLMRVIIVYGALGCASTSNGTNVLIGTNTRYGPTANPKLRGEFD